MGARNLKREVLLKKSIANLLLCKEQMISFILAFFISRARLIKNLMPFGLPFYISACSTGTNPFALAFFSLLGMFSAGGKDKIPVMAASMLLFNFLNMISGIPGKKRSSGTKTSKNGEPNSGNNGSKGNGSNKLNVKYSLLGLISSFIPEFVVVSIGGMLLYDLVVCIFTSLIVFFMTFIFRNFTLLIDRRKTDMFMDENLISMVITCAIAFSGFGDIKLVGFGIKNTACILALLILSYKYGAAAGAAIGVAAGLVLSMSSSTAPIVTGYYALCGLLSGIFSKLGKIGTVLGFLTGNILFLMYMGSLSGDLISLKDIILAVLLFVLIPQKSIMAVASFGSLLQLDSFDKAVFSLRAREMIVERLGKFSKAFMEVAKTVNEIASTGTSIDKNDISYMFDRVADRICKRCSLYGYCWDRNFYITYKNLFKIIEKLDRKGYIEMEDIPGYFIDNCERLSEFIQAINNMYEILKVDMMWKSKLGENRSIVSQQLEELSKAISGLAMEINTGVSFNSEIENMILLALRREGINAREVLAFENKYGRYEVDIMHKGCGGKRRCTNVISRIVSDIVGRKMGKASYGCCKKDGSKMCILKLVEEEKYNITTGVAAIPKYDEISESLRSSVSGDSYTFLNSSDGKYVLALSDGMGSGEKASMQSKLTIDLIERFMESGFDKDSTVKLVNSILALNSTEDNFATIDLCLINLDNGEIEFIKIGAAPTYIKRKNKTEIIKTISLPAGILDDMEIEFIGRQLEDGDLVIMLSDGVIQAFSKGMEDGEKNLLRFIDEIKSINPQAIADTIIDEAYNRFNGKPQDDITAIVAKFWKKAM